MNIVRFLNDPHLLFYRNLCSICLDVVTINQAEEEPQAFVAKLTTYQEPEPAETAKSPTNGAFDILDIQ